MQRRCPPSIGSQKPEKCRTDLQKFMSKKLFEVLLLHRSVCKQHLPPLHPFRLVAYGPTTVSGQLLADWNLWQTNGLHHRPNNGQTRSLCRECVNLVRAPSDVAKEAFNGIGRANVAMHDRRKGVKGQEILFTFHQAPYRFRIALTVFAFKGCQLGECLLFRQRLPDSSQLSGRSEERRV